MESLIVAGVVSLAWCALAIWLGPRIGYLDRPDDPSLKAHERPAVPLGGVGVFLAIHLAALTRGDIDVTLLLATGIVLILGLVDDRRGLTPTVRLGAEVAAALVLVAGRSSSATSLLFLALGVALVVLAVNAVNLFDGLDGLAGSVALVTGLGAAVIAHGRGLEPWVGLELAAALAGFLLFNWHPARVFLGDAGAYVVGLVLADAILGSASGDVSEMVVAAGILGVFAIDLVVTLIRRRLNERPLFTGDRSHIYDQLRDRGVPVRTIAAAAAASQLILMGAVAGADRILSPWQALLALALLAALLILWLASAGFLRVDPA